MVVEFGEAVSSEETWRESLLTAARNVSEAMCASVEGLVGALAGGSLGRGGRIDENSDADIWLLYRGEPPDAKALARVWGALGAIPLKTGEYLYENWPVELSCHDADAVATAIDRLVVEQDPTADHPDIHWLAYTVPLVDPQGVVAALQERLSVYPEALRGHICAKALAAMEKPVSQARACAERGDIVCFWGCVFAFMELYLDALFAHNRLWHPGPKRFLKLHLGRCERRPPVAAEQLLRLLDLEDGLSPKERASLIESLFTDLKAHIGRVE